MRSNLVNELDQEDCIRVSYGDDLQANLDHNARLRALPQKSDWGRHVASIPPIIMLKWLNEEWHRGSDVRYMSKEFDEIIAKKLKDPDWAYLRTDK
jgi:hypothetical protein